MSADLLPLPKTSTIGANKNFPNHNNQAIGQRRLKFWMILDPLHPSGWLAPFPASPYLRPLAEARGLVVLNFRFILECYDAPNFSIIVR